MQVQRHPDETDLPLIDKATTVVVWNAFSVVIVVRGIFISNDQASKRAAKERECADDFFVQAVCVTKGRLSKECRTVISRCADGKPLGVGELLKD